MEERGCRAGHPAKECPCDSGISAGRRRIVGHMCIPGIRNAPQGQMVTIPRLQDARETPYSIYILYVVQCRVPLPLAQTARRLTTLTAR
jgi:hypothetical protein